MKNDPIYAHYLSYIREKLDNKEISIGAFSLLKISREYFDDFKFSFCNNKHFCIKVTELYKREMRDFKIENLIKK